MYKLPRTGQAAKYTYFLREIFLASRMLTRVLKNSSKYIAYSLAYICSFTFIFTFHFNISDGINRR